MRRILPTLARQVGLIVVGLLVSCTSVPQARTEPGRLGMALRVSPQVGFAPLYVLAQILARDPEQVLRCPQFAIVAGVRGEPPEYVARFPGDVRCGPDGPLVHAPRARLLLLRRAGEYLIVASVADQGVALRARQTVNVIGRTEE